MTGDAPLNRVPVWLMTPSAMIIAPGFTAWIATAVWEYQYLISVSLPGVALPLPPALVPHVDPPGLVAQPAGLKCGSVVRSTPVTVGLLAEGWALVTQSAVTRALV